MILLRQTDDVLHTARIRREAGTVILHITFGESHVEFIECFTAVVDKIFEISRTCAHLFTDYHSAAGLDDIVELPVRNSQRCPCHKNPLRTFRNYRNAVPHTFLQLIGKAVAHLCTALRIVKEGDLSHEECVAS